MERSGKVVCGQTLARVLTFLIPCRVCVFVSVLSNRVLLPWQTRGLRGGRVRVVYDGVSSWWLASPRAV